MATFTIARTARKPHICTGGYCRTIQPGERYLRHTCSPNDPDVGNTGWCDSRECADCAMRYGRGELLDVKKD